MILQALHFQKQDSFDSCFRVSPKGLENPIFEMDMAALALQLCDVGGVLT